MLRSHTRGVRRSIAVAAVRISAVLPCQDGIGGLILTPGPAGGCDLSHSNCDRSLPAVWHRNSASIGRTGRAAGSKIVKNIITLLRCTVAASTTAVDGPDIHDDPLRHSIRSRSAS